MDFYNVDDLLLSGGHRMTSTEDDQPSFGMGSLEDQARPSGAEGCGGEGGGGGFDSPGTSSLRRIKVEEFLDDFDSGSIDTFRGRANTWHGGRPRLDEDMQLRDGGGGIVLGVGDVSDDRVSNDDSITVDSITRRKAATRRNAWGNQSYADLIAKAIESSPDQRLTLSQIYAWMVQNVPFFTDKGDTNSSAGWKNSIRHNLSLHSRFKRVQNEGAGKSSWWIVNAEVRPTRVPRRPRAATMDTQLGRRIGRGARGRNASTTANTAQSQRGLLSPAGDRQTVGGFLISSSDGGPSLDLSPAFSLSPQEMRARTSSNASSVGRLSPIQADLETDSDIAPWGTTGLTGRFQDAHYTGTCSAPGDNLAETLRESLTGIFNAGTDYTMDDGSTQKMRQQSSPNSRGPGPMSTAMSGYLSNAPLYTIGQQQQYHSDNPSCTGGIFGTNMVGGYFPSAGLTVRRNDSETCLQQNLISSRRHILPGWSGSGSRINTDAGTGGNMNSASSSPGGSAAMTGGHAFDPSHQDQHQHKLQHQDMLAKLLQQPLSQPLSLPQLPHQPQQIQQQQQPRLQPFLDRQSLIKLLSEKPHLKEKIKQLLVEKRQQRDMQLMQQTKQQLENKKQEQLDFDQQQQQRTSTVPLYHAMICPPHQQSQQFTAAQQLQDSWRQQLLSGGGVQMLGSGADGGPIQPVGNPLHPTVNGKPQAAAGAVIANGNPTVLPSDLDFDLRPSNDIECDINQIIDYDSLCFGDSFDFTSLNVDEIAGSRGKGFDDFSDILN